MMSLLTCLLTGNVAPVQSADIEVDLQLVLAVDASGSVDPYEFQLQLDGIADAFRNQEVQAAIANGPMGVIAVALIIWAEAGVPADESPWYLIRSEPDARLFASVAAGWQRRVNGGTGIGAGIVQAMRMFERNGYFSRRMTVDVSGDGRETPPRDYFVLIENARGMALSRGITVNGLAIQNEDRSLSRWYWENVATGPRSFVLQVDSYDDFAPAVMRKLLREIEDLPMSAALELPLP